MSRPIWFHAVSRQDGSQEDGIHLIWSAPWAAGYSRGGWELQRRPHREQGGNPRCHALTPSELARLHSDWQVAVPLAEITLRPGETPFWAGPPRKPARPYLAAASLAGPLAASVSLAPGWWVYQVDLGRPRQGLELHLVTPWALAVALREGTAVAARVLERPGGGQSLRLEDRLADQAVIYTPRRLSALKICRWPELKPDQEEELWQHQPYLTRRLHMPFRAVNPDLASHSQEEDLARSRLLPGESLEERGFKLLGETMNSAAQDQAPHSPVYASLLTRDQPPEGPGDESPPTELAAWNYGLAVTASPKWRRMLGLAFWDKGGGLTPHARYDYRLTGRFLRCDLEEPLWGFHTLPRGARLPLHFHLGPLSFMAGRPPVVRLHPEPPRESLSHYGRKGISIPGVLRISFPEPVRRVVLELEPMRQDSLHFRAFRGLFPGWPGTEQQGPVPARRRVELDLDPPVDCLHLWGKGFLYGVRFPALAPGLDPLEEVAVHAHLYGVAYEPSDPPPAPALLHTINLQQFIEPADPATDEPRPPGALGFRLEWPPPPEGGAEVPWPDDLDAYPPMAAASFLLERRGVDPPADWGPVDPPDQDLPGPVIYLGERGARPDKPVITFGCDLLELFPERPPTLGPVAPRISQEDVLRSMARPDGPPPGSKLQYRVWSLDVIGRRSRLPAEGVERRLEKRVAPPLPRSPLTPEGEEPPGLAPKGVRAYCLQASDRELGPEEEDILAGHANAVVLEWGWGPEQRRQDPYAREFRVYRRGADAGVVEGVLEGPATPTAEGWSVPARVEPPVGRDRLAGSRLLVGGAAFLILAHDPGGPMTLSLARPETDDEAVPGPQGFRVYLPTDGSELRPGQWERLACQPIEEGRDNYRSVLHDIFTVDDAHPQTSFWVGVSSADDQDYVPDEVSGPPWGGRPGNESSIVAVSLAPRYRGRPEFVAPSALPAVPEVVLAEPTGEEVAASVDLAAAVDWPGLPAGHQVLLERLAGGEVSSRLAVGGSGGVVVLGPEGEELALALEHPDDRAALEAQLAGGQPGAVESRFLLAALRQHPQAFGGLWARVGEGPGPLAARDDRLPAQAERYFYRVRQADRAGHLSLEAAVLGVVHRVPSLRRPGPPRVRAGAGAGGAVPLTLEVAPAWDLPWALVFSLASPADEEPPPALDQEARLLRVPNHRGEISPAAGAPGIRLRLADGTLLEPRVVELPAGPGARAEVESRVEAGPDRRVVAWAACLSRDRIPSPPAGPVAALTPPGPLEPGAPSVTPGPAGDLAAWGAVDGAREYALETSRDGGDTWQWASPWLPGDRRSHLVENPPAGPRQYRLVAQGRGGRTGRSAAVSVS
jgi:hypothetical protein